jgi:hypothetical protein
LGEIEVLKNTVTQRLRRVRGGDKFLEKIADIFKNYSKLACFILLHEVGHIRLKHIEARAKVDKILNSENEEDLDNLMSNLIKRISKNFDCYDLSNIFSEDGDYVEALEAEADLWSLNELEKYTIIEQECLPAK